MIKRFIDRRVTCLQFTKASEWENCLRVDTKTAKDVMPAWLDNFHGAHIGIEAFFSAQEFGDGDSFAGVRLPFDSASALLCRALVNDFLSAGGSVAMACFVARLRKLGPFFEYGADFMELGAVNMWNSFGPLRFWKRGECEPYAAFARALAAESRFSAVISAPAAIEFAMNKPAPHWLGLTVSRVAENNGRRLSIKSVKAALSLAQPSEKSKDSRRR